MSSDLRASDKSASAVWSQISLPYVLYLHIMHMAAVYPHISLIYIKHVLIYEGVLTVDQKKKERKHFSCYSYPRSKKMRKN